MRFSDWSSDVCSSDLASVNADAQTVTFTFPKHLPAGNYRLDIDYSGKIYTQAAGLFALDYEAEGKKKRALFTQFEAADARHVIPSWDEPIYKATFDQIGRASCRESVCQYV